MVIKIIITEPITNGGMLIFFRFFLNPFFWCGTGLFSFLGEPSVYEAMCSQDFFYHTVAHFCVGAKVQQH